MRGSKGIFHATAAAPKSLQSCPTLCDPIDGNPPGSPVPGILQARTLEWVAISFSNAWKWKVKVKLLSCVWLLVTPWTAASSVHGIFQARVLELDAITFSILKKLEIELPYDLAVPLLGIYLKKNENTNLNRYMHPIVHAAAAAAAKLLQSCPTLCDPIDGSSPGSPVPRILQARILEWVAVS